MKLHSLLLLPAIIGSAIVPILSMSLPAQSISDLLPDQTIDFGTQQQSSQQPFPSAPLSFTVPEGQVHYRITPESTSPFTVKPKSDFVGNNNHNVVVAVNLEKSRPIGVHQQLITVKSGGKTIKTVLLKVYIPPATTPPGQNPQPTPSNPAQ
jgi:hypothetical protein